ncbi:xylulokinase [Bosea sp. UNC402CLCol]|uniref:xylulokinase n=1 Tax=Bosea sp. UNC402CLCol TaxID=1510531 RepID=UPI00056EB02C|nr:xylulokinase [Bosea sp. UNC402CLCol]
MFLGIDLGTSSLKAVLVDTDERVVAEASEPLTVSRPQPLWSEQSPEDWWQALDRVLRRLKAERPAEMAGARGLGLSGQMHGAVLLDAQDRVLRPAILWNDGRSGAECRLLEEREPRSRAITGNLAMPGFTAPKLVWVQRHEPEIFAGIAKVLLPKDYLRLRLTGEPISDMSDSAGTLWLDVAARRWSQAMLDATGLSKTAMPRLVEGSEPGGVLRDTLATEWGLPKGVVVAGGAGDNAAGAVGIGAITPGQGFLSLGTSGVIFTTSAAYSANPTQAVHSFCHALPGLWHQMAVMLSAASSLSWVSGVTGTTEAALLDEIANETDRPGEVVFLPYLSGERTPHNDPQATGLFAGLTHGTRRSDLGRAVLEGVGFSFADGLAALEAVGPRIETLSVIGGGARSALWGEILAAILDRPLEYRAGGERGGAFGAARLARLAVTGEAPEALCKPPALERVVTPRAEWREAYQRLYARYRAAYRREGNA